MSATASPVRGFTLVEVLVAITLMALLALMSWRGISHAVNVRNRALADMEQTARVLRALAQIERDITQRIPDAALPLPVRSGTLPNALQVETNADHGVTLRLLRAAPADGGPLRMQAIRYTVENGSLVRYASTPQWRWPATEEETRVALETCARKLAVRANSNGLWIDLPAAAGVAIARVTGIEITIECDADTRYTRVFEV